MRFVLDATALRSGLQLADEHEWFATDSVMEEVRLGKAGRDLDLQRDLTLNVVNPGSDSLTKVKAAAESTGDQFRLSGADLDVLALALELDATIVTDDYSIQNCARAMGIKFRPGDLEGIREVYYWKFKCIGCGKIFESKLDECDVCGSAVKTVRKR